MRRSAFVIAGIAALCAAAWYFFLNTPPAQKNGTATSPSAPVITVTAQADNFAIRRRTIGILESPAIVVVKSRIQSQVTEQHVTDGQLVKKGDLLFTLDDREVKATIARSEAQLAKDQATAEKTQTDLDRYSQLSSTNAVPRQQFDQATADHKIALATVDSDKAQLRADNLQLDYITIEAPIGGRLGSVRVTPGNLVSVNDDTGLVTITQVRPIRVAFTLAERDLAALRKAYITKPAAAVRVYTAGTKEALATGELDFVDSAVDTASGTIAAKAKFANENFQLWPGSYVDVEIDLSVRPNTVMIPTVAIQSGQSGPFVFVVKDGQKDGQKAEMRKVELAGSDGERTALASGVNDGERVIVEGQMRLIDGAAVTEAKPAVSDNKAAVATPPAGGSR
ncbi:MAG: family efflux transporter subunit [Rhizobium sp.]|nr:family efflux transporter subunit [Rhizobium sp.]